MMNRLTSYFNNKQKLIDLTAGLLALSVSISAALPNILLIPLGLLVFINFRNFKNLHSKALLFFAIGVLAVLLLALYKQTFLQDIKLYSRYLLIFLLFLFFAQVSNKRVVEYLFILGALIAVIGSSISIAVAAYDDPDFILANGEMVNHVLWLERPYFGFILALCVFICLKNGEKNKRRYDYYLLTFIFIGFNIYISARLGMGLSCILVFIYLFRSYHIQKKAKVFLGIVLSLLIALALGLSDNLLARMQITNNFDNTTAKIKDYEPRFVIWPCAMEIIKNETNFLIGQKAYDQVEQKLTNCYESNISKKSKRDYYLNSKFNTHNQFLDFFLIGGIFPVLFLLIMFCYAWFAKAISFEMSLIFFLFFAFFMVENVLHRQLGCYLFGIFVGLYSRKKNE